MIRISTMKKLHVLVGFSALLLLACSREAHPGDPEVGLLSFSQRQRILENTLAGRKEGEDLSLYLYRHPATRKLVVDFYVELTKSTRIAHPILANAERYEIPLPLAFSLAWVESSFQMKATNWNRYSVDRGLFQLNSQAFPKLRENEFYDPQINARYGLAHLRFCLNTGGNEIVALAMYNAGTRKVNAGTPYSTLNYIARILDYRSGLEQQFQSTLFRSDSLVRLSRLGTGN